jgi:TrmH family RNA methyltransferase
MNFRLKRYKKDFDYSYAFGVFPALELLTHRPQDCIGVILHPRGDTNRGVAKIRAICEAIRIPFGVQEKTLARIGARENDYAAAIFEKTAPPLDPSANHIALVKPANPGNLGTIIRTALAFNFRDLAVIQPAADIFHPDVVRASMGALFQLRFEHFSDFGAYREAYPRNFYPLMTDGETPLPKARFKTPFGLVFGPENAGLPESFRTVGTALRIPQSDAVDSLNLAIAVGITLYQVVSRQ